MGTEHNLGVAQIDGITDLRESVQLAISTMNAQVEEVRALRAGLDASLVTVVRAAVKEEMMDEREYNRAIFDSMESRLRRCIEVQDTAIDRHETELGLTRVKIANIEANSDRVPKLDERLETLEKRPGNRAITAIAAVGGAATVGIVGLGIEWIKGKLEGK